METNMRNGLALLIAAVAGASCAPIQSATAISRAEEELRTAQFAHADEWAPYEYTKADLYLKMAKERQGFSDFEAAKEFAEEAQRLASTSKDSATQNLRLKQRREGPAPLKPVPEGGR